MKITRISPNAHLLTRLGLCNCYLIAESDGFTLIDTTIPGSAKPILAAAQAINHGPSAASSSPTPTATTSVPSTPSPSAPTSTSAAP